MKKFICLLISLLMLLPVVASCKDDTFVTDPEYIDDGKLTVKFGSTDISVNQINSSPEADKVVIYTKDYKYNGAYSMTVAEKQEGRVGFAIRRVEKDGNVEFDIVERLDDVSAIPIPVNGFALSVPSDMLEGVRANKGQLVKVEGFEEILAQYERHDMASMAPDYLLSTATRRVNLVNPIGALEDNKIYYIDSEFEGERELSVNNLVVTVKVSTNYSCEIVSIESKGKISAPANNEAYFVFMGEYNVAYADYYLKSAERISFSMIDKANSYTDIPAVLTANGLIQFKDSVYNVENIEEDGIFVYDNSFVNSVTPATDKKRIDIVIVEGYVAQISEQNARSLIPDGNGFVVSLVGEAAIKRISDFEIGKSLETFFIEYRVLPNKYVEVNNKFFEVSNVDGARVPEGAVILYTNLYGATTGTNEYGSEIVFENGKVTEVHIGAGNSKIPANGYVLSVHKDCPNYSEIKKIKVGDSVDISLTGSDYSVTQLKFDAINQTRLEDMLIVYRNKTNSGANEFGYEIAVDKDGFAVSHGYAGNIAIPKGGFALSGHGISKTALENVYSVGARVLVDDKAKSVTVIRTPAQKLQTATTNFAAVSDKLAEAKKAFLNLDYKGLDEQFALISGILEEANEAFDSFDFDKALASAESIIATCGNLSYSLIESKAAENRAVWHRSYEKSDEEVRATVEKLKLLNVNAIYLETWYEGNCLGAKVDIDGITTPAVNGDYDALDGFVRICHENGIEVHSWVHNFFVGFYYDDGREYYNPLFKEYKDKYLLDIKGRDFFYYTANNNKFIFLNSNDRECRDLILSIYEQLITKYEIDGLHLDYIRYPELNYGTDDFGYNQDIIDDFAAQSGIKGDPRYFADGSAEKKAWIQFRCDIITDWMREVHDMVRENRPELWLSAATYPDIELSKNTIAQDVRTFAERGYLDEIFSMSYGVDSATVLSSVNDYTKITNGKTFYTAGIAAFLETVPDTFAYQLTDVEIAGADGVSIFALGNINGEKYQQQIVNGAFRDPSVQVYKLSETVSAQMKYISQKADNLSTVCEKLSSEKLGYIKSKCDAIKADADAFDLKNATISEKLAWCYNAQKLIDTAISDIKAECGENNETKAFIDEFEDLRYWLTLTAKRLETRK